MEAKVIRAILVLTVMLLFLAGQSSATSIKSCYDCCYQNCRKENAKGFCKYRCGLECAALPVPTCPTLLPDDCSLACAKSSCAHIDPEGKDMEGCVAACAKKCADQQH